jgi:hypothetical protein
MNQATAALEALSATSPKWPRTFFEAYRDKSKCRPEDFERFVFWQTLYRHAVPLAFVIHRFVPSFFKEDFGLIRELGPMQDAKLFLGELNRFHGRNLRDKNWIRRTFHIRVSARRLINLKNRLLQNPSPAPPPSDGSELI